MPCSGENCPLHLTCAKFRAFVESDDDVSPIIPNYHDGTCMHYEQIEFYGQ